MSLQTPEARIRAALHHVAGTTPLTPDLDAVLARTDSASPANPRWRLPRVAAVAVLVLVLAVGIIMATGLFGSAGRAMAVRQLDDGRLRVDLVAAATTDADGVATALEEFGLDVSIIPTPVAPGQVNQILGFSGSHVTGPGGPWPPPGITFLEGSDGTPNVMLIDPMTFRGTLDIQVGVLADEDESYGHSTNAFLDDGPLAGVDCSIGDPLTAEALAPVLKERGLTPIWWIVSNPRQLSDGGIDYTIQPYLAGVPDGEIISARPTSANMIRLGVLPAALDAPFVPTHLDEFPCDRRNG